MLRLTSKSFVSNLRNAQKRCIHSSRSLLKAEIFSMPAMSPTMNEGGVTEWKFKEGDSFKSGDILLEVETDKSQIDVEAQDDGILAKIIKADGSKDVPVGEAIAIIAEPGDDLATLELPEIKSSSKGEPAKKQEPTKKEEPKKQEPATTKKSSPSESSSSSSSDSVKADPKQTFFPSVASLLEANKISKEDALSNIKASGPNGRIVKGDVLAYLGRISQESVSKVSNFINSHAKLDLSNIEKLKITPKEAEAKKEAKPEKPKKEIKVISETFNLTSLEVTAEDFAGERGIHFDLTQYVTEASKRAEQFAYQPKKVSSDYYDPIFEDLVSLPTNLERFTVDLDIQAPKQVESFDVTDLLDFVDSKPANVPDPTVTVKVTVNPKVADSEEKANAFISKFRSYITSPGF